MWLIGCPEPFTLTQYRDGKLNKDLVCVGTGFTGSMNYKDPEVHLGIKFVKLGGRQMCRPTKHAQG